MKRFAILSLALVWGAGCQSTTPEPTPSAARPLLFAGEVDPGAAAAERLTAQLARLDAPACRQTRMRLVPDLAHELFVRSSSPALRGEAAQALSDPAYLASEAARARAPEVHDGLRARLVAWIDDRSGDPADLAAGFTDLGDGLLAAELVQRARARGVELAGAAATSPLQRARGAWLDLAQEAGRAQPDAAKVHEVLRQARSLQHLGILDALDALCAASPDLLPAAERNQLARDRARVALLRRDGARALRAAVVALRGSAPGTPRVQARLLLARAQRAAGEREAALAEAQTASEEAAESKSRVDEARALGLLGAVFLELGKAEAAASAYEGAARAALAAGQGDLALRQQLNLATARLRAGRLNAAREALRAAGSYEPSGPDRAELQGQRQVTRALVGLVSGELRPAAAALEVESALQAARAVGCPEIVERYATLPARLRGARSGG
jgi:hypothetical protein